MTLDSTALDWLTDSLCDSNLKYKLGDFPGGPVVKNLPSNAGDMGSSPGRGTEIPQATGQLSTHATTREPEHRNYWARALWSPRATTREKLVCLNEEPAHRNERSRMRQLRPNTAKINK